MLALQEISDRLELLDLVHAYASGVDSRDYAAVAAVFTPDARIECAAFGGPDGGVEEMLEWASSGITVFAASHHLTANHRFVINGDNASGVVMCFNPMQWNTMPGEPDGLCVMGLYYHDEYQRHDGKWFIASRVMKRTYAMTNIVSAPA